MEEAPLAFGKITPCTSEIVAIADSNRVKKGRAGWLVPSQSNDGTYLVIPAAATLLPVCEMARLLGVITLRDIEGVSENLDKGTFVNKVRRSMSTAKRAR